MRIGLLTHDTRNLGDDLQQIAARQFLPRVDVHIDRDDLSGVSEPTKLILSGWFLHGRGPNRREPFVWPPHENVVPLLISFHVSTFAEHVLLTRESIAYFRKHGPVGCRDRQSVSLLRRYGVEAYLSGCLTLTLRNRKPRERSGKYWVDVPNKPAAPDGWREMTHYTRMHGTEVRMKEAERLLNCYATAEQVVTGRLHCALPCLAFGTPCEYRPKKRTDRRNKGLLRYLANPDDESWRKLAKSMRATCENFMERE